MQPFLSHVHQNPNPKLSWWALIGRRFTKVWSFPRFVGEGGGISLKCVSWPSLGLQTPLILSRSSRWSPLLDYCICCCSRLECVLFFPRPFDTDTGLTLPSGLFCQLESYDPLSKCPFVPQNPHHCSIAPFFLTAQFLKASSLAEIAEEISFQTRKRFVTLSVGLVYLSFYSCIYFVFSLGEDPPCLAQPRWVTLKYC